MRLLYVGGNTVPIFLLAAVCSMVSMPGEVVW